MFNGKMKAFTMSFDDGILQDIRFIELLDRYGIKATFNLNSNTLGKSGTLIRNEREVRFDKVAPEDVAAVYKNHEVAVHTLDHPNLRKCDEDEVYRQIEQDRIALEKLSGKTVQGMAYPCGGLCFSDKTVEVLKKTGVKFSRTTLSTFSFEPQSDLYRFNHNHKAPKIRCFRRVRMRKLWLSI